MSDDVVEAMAGAIHDAEPGAFRPWVEIVKAEANGGKLAILVAGSARDKARAAIRAVVERGGLVVGKMPGNTTSLLGDYAKGWNNHDAAVRANAVKVEP